MISAELDADHAGSVPGTIDYESPGSNLPSAKRAFNLFSPTDDPKTKYIANELGFNSSDGKAYYISGCNEVRDAPLSYIWKATTTDK